MRGIFDTVVFGQNRARSPRTGGFSGKIKAVTVAAGSVQGVAVVCVHSVTSSGDLLPGIPSGGSYTLECSCPLALVDTGANSLLLALPAGCGRPGVSIVARISYVALYFRNVRLSDPSFVR